MKINAEFEIGQMVYVVTDPMQEEHIVIGILVTRREILYQIRFGMEDAFLNGFELSAERDDNKILNIDA